MNYEKYSTKPSAKIPTLQLSAYGGKLFNQNDLKDYIIQIDGYKNQIKPLWGSFLIKSGFDNVICFTTKTNKHYEYNFVIKDKEGFEFINECNLIYI